MSFLNPSVFFSDLRAPTVCSEKKIKPKNFSAQDDLKNLLRARSRRSERALTCGNARAHRCLPNTRPHVFKVNVRNKRKVFSKMLRRVRRVWNISEPTNTCRRYFFKFPAHFFPSEMRLRVGRTGERVGHTGEQALPDKAIYDWEMPMHVSPSLSPPLLSPSLCPLKKTCLAATTYVLLNRNGCFLRKKSV